MTHEAGVRPLPRPARSYDSIKAAGASPYPTGCKSLEQRQNGDAGTGGRGHGWCEGPATPADHASRVMATVRGKKK
ncbi:hypothetical protein CSHISOI_11090 [Colletotrichum shisoi]|uniref:Uncharacterized protein n=1 Tax=Colletotrichum shisoi TaxID=2078593 RepID=A0A5Q4BCE0_9PEZI|nr:hypothetical protein CSHISOI_11090 [Colletotrichum shisoi]